MTEENLSRKQRPTPKQKTSKAVVSPPPMNKREARLRKKELNRKMSKEERQTRKLELRSQRQKNQELLKQGDERVLPAKDRGPERRYVRDFVDQRRMLANYFVYILIIMLVVSITNTSTSKTANIINMAIMSLVLSWMVVSIMETFFYTRKIFKTFSEKYPNHSQKKLSTGFYLLSRAMLPRKFRVPLPRVALGEKIFLN